MKNAGIMLIDDDPDIRTLLREFLKMQGYRVATYSDGAKALESLAQASAPEVILLDWQMPLMSGREFMTAFSKLGIADSIPVYLFSSTQNTDEAMTSGCAGVLTKPLDFWALLAMIKSISLRKIEASTSESHP